MRKVITTAKAPAALGPYSQGVRVGDYLFVSGQLGIDPSSVNLIDTNIGTETEQALKNINAILEDSGMTMNHIVKTTVYLTDLANFDEMNQVYSVFFPHNPPARATVEVKRLPKNARVEIDCIAVK